jgi:phosphatidate cytidylyltransferase
VTDRPTPDGSDEERSQATPVEGVRILGAEEAQAALEQRRPGARAASDIDDEIDLEPELRDHPSGDSEPPSGEVPPLPHWTEPPTGAVPAIFADDDDESADELDVWAPLTGSQPRFRAEGSDWADPDYVEELGGGDDDERLGALSETGPVDEEAAFAEALAARRRSPRGRPSRTMTTPSPARTRTADTEPEVAPAPQGRDLPLAIGTALVMAVVALICFNQGETWTAALVSLIVGLGTLEFANALRQRGFRPAALLAFVGSLTLPLAAQHYGVSAYPVYFALITVFSMLWFLWEVTPGRPLVGVATTMLTFGYIGALGGFAGLMLTSSDGVGLVLGVAICVIAYDVFGYFVGSQFGHNPIAPTVSPNKTIEGTVAGMAASLILGWLLVGQIHPWTTGKGAVLGLLVAAGAFLGDLCESLLKRDLGIKDFGSVLPGHGGALDRFDSMLFCLPIGYYLAVSFNIL